MQSTETEPTPYSPDPRLARIDDICLWSSLGVYSLVWVSILLLTVPQPLFLPFIWTGTYVGMHVYSIKVRGNCYLFADSVAGPVTTAVFAVTYLVLPVLGFERPPIINVFLGGMAAFFAGHITALLYAEILKSVLGKWVMPPSRQSQEGSTPDPVPSADADPVRSVDGETNTRGTGAHAPHAAGSVSRQPVRNP